MTYSKIVGTGSYLPKKILTNHDLESVVDTSDSWIRSRTGIEQRHIAAENETASDLAMNACLKAIESADISADKIDLIIVATTTPDMTFPSTACILQSKLGIKDCPAFDVQAVCSGFVYALATADMFIRAGRCNTALVVGTEIYSRLLDWNDRSTCVLFGDGAGAVLITKSDQPGILSSHLHANGSHYNALSLPGNISHGKISSLTPCLPPQFPPTAKFSSK